MNLGPYSTLMAFYNYKSQQVNFGITCPQVTSINKGSPALYPPPPHIHAHLKRG